MNMFKTLFGIRCFLIFAFIPVLANGAAKPIATRVDALQWETRFAAMPTERQRSLDAPGDLVDFATSLAASGIYFRQFQADITEDNADNGINGIDESPDDPDDGGWDWVLYWTTDPHSHSMNASPTNIYGATALGAYYAYLEANDAQLWTTLLDAANAMVAAGPSAIRTSADMQFLMLFDDLYDLEVGPTTMYEDAAKAKYDARIALDGSATALASTIRDVRGVTQGYPNGLIGWDIGLYAVVAQMLYERYGMTYDQDADDIAEVLWQDSFNDSPGLFDVIDDAGWDPMYGDVDYWWYTLGITGLLDAFTASGSHTSEIPFLVQQLKDSQFSNGAFSFSYGANSGDEDWQSSAYAVMSLNAENSIANKVEIGNGAYWIAATQSIGGAWVYGNDEHYPEIVSENASAVSLGFTPDEVWVDDSWTGQASVDLYNIANNTKLVWGYTAFASIPTALIEFTGGTLHLLAGTYTGQLHLIGYDSLQIIGAGIDSTFIKAPSTTMPHIYFASGPNRPILFLDSSTVHVSNLTINGDGRGANNSRMIGAAFWNSDGSLDNVNIINVRDTPLNGNQQGVGVSVNNIDNIPHYVSLNNVSISTFQKNGTSFTGPNTTVDCDSVRVVGHGPNSIVVQNGIQYSSGSRGTVTNSTVTGVGWTGAIYVATSYLAYQAEQVDFVNASSFNGQAGIYAIDSDGSISGGRIESMTAATTVGKLGIRVNSSASALAMTQDLPQLYRDQSDEFGRHDISHLDDDEVYSVTGTEIVGDGTVRGVGLYGYVDGGNLDLVVADNTILNWATGIDLTRVGAGTISPAVVTGNVFTNSVNTFDNSVGHYWDSNCYSDFATNFGYPGAYEVPGALPWNQDNNPNPNGCYELNLLMAEGPMGCANSDCSIAPLCLTLAMVNVPNLQLTIQLPASIIADLPAQGTVVTPSSNADPNLIQAFAINLGGGLLQVDIGFQGMGSVGDFSKYIACIPLRNIGYGTGAYAVEGVSSLWIDALGVEHPNELILGKVAARVDCAPPTISSFTGSPSCSFGRPGQTEGIFSATFSDSMSGIGSAWVTASPGNQTFVIFDSVQNSPLTVSFPSADDTSAFFNILTSGCNTLTLHVADGECNDAITMSLANIGLDTTAPSLAISTSLPPDTCLNNDSTSAIYGGSMLDEYLDITSSLGVGDCRANSGTLVISHIDLVDFVVNLNVTNYPSDNAQALALWTWMLGYVPLSIANGDSFTFDVKAIDCAGNESPIQQFTICVDIQAPENTFTEFDARPAHNGIWLKWSWEANASAQEMRIYRSPLSSEYPAYLNDLWNDISQYDVTSLPPAGWTLVASQITSPGTYTSAIYTGQNNRGDALTTHTDGSGTYWLDADTNWVDGNGNSNSFRDIYRYVTLVRDAGGNWSLGDTVEVLENADRSTNYWLGDFSTSDAVGDTHSRGRVDTDDLSLLSAVYFTAAGGYRNIGPAVLENGSIGKGIPGPDFLGQIDFDDLTPFSFNFGSVSPVGYTMTEFAVLPEPEVRNSFQALDDLPHIDISTVAQMPLPVGSEFVVSFDLTGNENNSVKAVEVKLGFDNSLLDYVSSSIGTASSSEGTVFAKTSTIEGAASHVGIVAASCGGRSTLSGNASLGTITFRVKSEMPTTCSIDLISVQMLDNTGAVQQSGGETIELFNASPTVNSYALFQNYPNPFNPTTNLQFSIPEAGNVRILVFNTLGQMVSTVSEQHYEAGTHNVTFDASELASGVYIYSISVNGFTDLKKMVLIR